MNRLCARHVGEEPRRYQIYVLHCKTALLWQMRLGVCLLDSILTIHV